MSSSYFAGMALGLGLIVAIGAQNAFILRQGIRREHVFWVCLLCAASDAILVSVGVLGFGQIVASSPTFALAMRLGGAAFLLAYGLRSLHSAWRGGQALQAAQGPGVASLGSVLTTCAALTWLNPHVYLDTVVLLGGLSQEYASPGWFALGAVTSSFTFMFSLGYGARLLAPLFDRPQAWRVLDSLVGLTMGASAVQLLWG